MLEAMSLFCSTDDLDSCEVTKGDGRRSLATAMPIGDTGCALISFEDPGVYTQQSDAEFVFSPAGASRL